MEMVLQEKYQDYSVYTLPLWSMACKSSQPEQVARFSNVITLENHLHDAGFGSWLMESLSENRELRARIINIAYDPVVAGSVGSEHYLNMVGGLTEKYMSMV